jgi:hypothetical protein
MENLKSPLIHTLTDGNNKETDAMGQRKVLGRSR